MSFVITAFFLSNTARIAPLSSSHSSEAFAADFQQATPQSVETGESRADKRLDRSTRDAIPKYGQTLQENGRAFKVDWRLLLAVMQVESRFVEDAESPRGAQGLMQIMPTTQIEVAARLGLDSLSTVDEHIRGSAYYFASLYQLFEGADPENRIKLAIAAYNSGPGRIYDAQDITAYLGENPKSWQSIKMALPLLSKRYYTLHKLIWDGGKPRNGFFGEWRQTIDYVDRVMINYERFRRVLG